MQKFVIERHLVAYISSVFQHKIIRLWTNDTRETSSKQSNYDLRTSLVHLFLDPKYQLKSID